MSDINILSKERDYNNIEHNAKDKPHLLNDLSLEQEPKDIREGDEGEESKPDLLTQQDIDQVANNTMPDKEFVELSVKEFSIRLHSNSVDVISLCNIASKYFSFYFENILNKPNNNNKQSLGIG